MHTPRIWILCLGLLPTVPALSLLGGCKAQPTAQSQSWSGPLAPAGPFAATSLRVHPLSHYDIGVAGDPRVVVHIELEDRWGDAVKASGELSIRLRDPRPGAEDRSAKWDIPLRDLELNNKLYDPATLTYRITLGHLPAWLRNETGQDPEISVEATLRTTGPTGTLASLHDEYTMRR